MSSAKLLKRVSNQQSDPPSHDGGSSPSADDTASEEQSEKDETEEELERLVFGDRIGFRAGLEDSTVSEKDAVQENDIDITGLEGLEDGDLFFTDLGSEDKARQLAMSTVDNEQDDTFAATYLPPAWEDSDDERIFVSLANNPKLRKLRKTEDEDIINGKEYSKRLRQYYEQLHPTPRWAREAMERHAAKRRRLSQTEEPFDSDASSEGMEIDEESPNVAPLSKLLQSAGSLTKRTNIGIAKKRKLRPETINIERQRDIDQTQPSAITSLSFHPTLPLLLSSGPTSTLYLHQLSPSPPAPTPNPLLTSLHVRGLRLTTTAFHPSDSRVFLSSRRRFFHIWNLSTGRVEKISRVAGHQHEQRSMEVFKISPDGGHIALLGTSKKNTGTVNILDATTLQWTTLVRVESQGGVADFAWWRNGKGMSVASKQGEITEWELAGERVIARWQDEGAVGTTTLALGGRHEFQKSAIGPDRWIAVGSSSGIVNLYDRRAWLTDAGQIPSNPKPTRALDHITTSITQLAFSPDGQILAMASRWARDALRLVHLPSCTVFKNWPTSATPFGRITGVAFASGEVVEGDDVLSVLAVANDRGKIRLWHVR